MPFLRQMVCLLPVVFVFSAIALPQTPSRPPASLPVQAPLPPTTAQETVLGYWTSETGWASELQLRNNTKSQTLSVTPVLRLPNGSEASMEQVTIRPQEIVSVDLNAVIASSKVPEFVGSYGSVALRFQAPSVNNLYASIMIRNIGHPFSFHIDGAVEEQGIQVGSREGIWWLPNATVKDYLVLTNMNSNDLPLDLSVYDASGKEETEHVVVNAHGTARYSIRKLVQQAGITGTYGGVKVRAKAHAGSFDTQHILYD